jgi:hypothetical protein
MKSIILLYSTKLETLYVTILQFYFESSNPCISNRDANPFWSLSWRKFFKGGAKG